MLGNVLGDGVRGASHWPSLWAPVLWLWRGCPGLFLKSHVCFDETGTRAKEERLCVMESSRFGPGPEVMFVFASCRSEEGHFGGRKVSFRPQEPPYHIRGGHRGTEGLCLGSKTGVPSSRRRRKGHLFSPSLEVLWWDPSSFLVRGILLGMPPVFQTHRVRPFCSHQIPTDLTQSNSCKALGTAC